MRYLALLVLIGCATDPPPPPADPSVVPDAVYAPPEVFAPPAVVCTNVCDGGVPARPAGDSPVQCACP